MKRFAAVAAACLFAVAAGCGPKSSPADGTGAAPSGTTAAAPKKLVFGFQPSVEADKIAENAKPMADFISKEIGIPVETFTSTDYTGMIEAMGSDKVDIAALAPLAYVLAEDQVGAQLLLKTSRSGKTTYHAMFVTRADSGIKTLEQAKGKRIAWVDQSSASGYLFPAAYLKSKGYDPDTFFSQSKFAGSHDNAVRSVYNGDVDVASVYDDARNKLEASTPDVKQKVVKFDQTQEIPNDTFCVRKGLDPALTEKIKAALLKYAATEDGKKVLKDTYEIDGLVEAKPEDYAVVRDTAKSMGITLSALDKKK